MPIHSIFRKVWFWVLLFGGLFALSQDFWNWGDVRPGPLNLPWWMFTFIVLQLLFAIVFTAFLRVFPEPGKREQEGPE